MPYHPRIHRNRLVREAEGYLELGLPSHALNSLLRLDAAGSQNRHSLYLRGEALRGLDKYDESITWLEKAAEADSGNYHILLALGWCHKRLGRVDLAVRSLRSALEVEEDEAIIYYNLACYYSLEQRKPETLEYLTQAFELDSGFRDLVHEESDFFSLRDDPDFQNLTSVVV